MKKFFIIAVLVAFANKGYSTAIFIYKGKDTIYVAADSRRTFFPNSSHADTLHDTICKILTLKKVNFAFSGYADPVLRNNAHEYFKDYTQSVDSSYRRFISDAKEYFKDVFDKAKINDTAIYNRYYRISICAISMFGFQNDTPFLTTSVLHIGREKDTGAIVESAIYGNYVPLGLHDHIDTLTIPLPVEKNGIIYNFGAAVKLESQFHPSLVGGLIDLLQVTKNGLIWVTPRRECN